MIYSLNWNIALEQKIKDDTYLYLIRHKDKKRYRLHISNERISCYLPKYSGSVTVGDILANYDKSYIKISSLDIADIYKNPSLLTTRLDSEFYNIALFYINSVFDDD